MTHHHPVILRLTQLPVVELVQVEVPLRLELCVLIQTGLKVMVTTGRIAG